jgi:PPM family protein phosphatase
MAVMGIGEFARRSLLSPKALRHYHELGLLAPARVDPDSGYRWYADGQLERARLVAALRKLGIPLTRIKLILELDAGAAAGHVAADKDEPPVHNGVAGRVGVKRTGIDS